MDSVNPELGVDDQAELLPYDNKWEFSRENLKLGNRLKAFIYLFTWLYSLKY